MHAEIKLHAAKRKPQGASAFYYQMHFYRMELMAEYDFDIGVIGGGSGGLTVAAGASQFGAKTLLEDKDMADEVMNIMSSEGVIFYLNAAGYHDD